MRILLSIGIPVFVPPESLSYHQWAGFGKYLVSRYIIQRIRKSTPLHKSTPQLSSRRPIGRFIVAAGRQLVRLRTVCQHGPDLPGAAAGRFENQVAAIGGPAGTLVAALVAGQLDDLPRGGVHDVDVVVVVGPAPTEGQQLAIGRPCGVDD